MSSFNTFEKIIKYLNIQNYVILKKNNVSTLRIVNNQGACVLSNYDRVFRSFQFLKNKNFVKNIEISIKDEYKYIEVVSYAYTESTRGTKNHKTCKYGLRVPVEYLDNYPKDKVVEDQEPLHSTDSPLEMIKLMYEGNFNIEISCIYKPYIKESKNV